MQSGSECNIHGDILLRDPSISLVFDQSASLEHSSLGTGLTAALELSCVYPRIALRNSPPWILVICLRNR